MMRRATKAAATTTAMTGPTVHRTIVCDDFDGDVTDFCGSVDRTIICDDVAGGFADVCGSVPINTIYRIKTHLSPLY